MSQIIDPASAAVIIVNTCDAYEDVWALFFAALVEQWPDCPYRIVVNTESRSGEVDRAGVVFHHCPVAPGSVDQWGLRLRKTLESLSCDIVIMLYDDYVLQGPVDDRLVRQAVSDIQANADLAAFYLIHNPENKNLQDGRFDRFEKIPVQGDYVLNSAPAVWRRSALLELVQDHDTPWAWEFFGGYRCFSKAWAFYCIQAAHERVYPYAYKMGGAIYRGKWVGAVVAPLIERYGLKLDLAQRGLADSQGAESRRSLKWKIDFFLLGYRMVGFGAAIFFFRTVKKKLQRKFAA